MKVHILFELLDKASGGGNQFLKALKLYFRARGAYTDRLCDADVILFNSHHFILDVIVAKIRFPEKIFIHRIDGPMRLYNNVEDKRDFFVNKLNEIIADATVFQSLWSKNKNLSMGLNFNKFNTTIINAPNPLFFNKSNNTLSSGEKYKVVATSWSTNMNKGFLVYQWLDKNLNFDKYEMTFIGNSPISFNNIIHKRPMSSKELSSELKESDIFITASCKDPCSNSLIEALHCGLPVVALNDGGHQEIVLKGGLMFEQKEDIPALLDRIVDDYYYYQRSICIPSLNDVGSLYFEFMSEVFKYHRTHLHKQNHLTLRRLVKLMVSILRCKYLNYCDR